MFPPVGPCPPNAGPLDRAGNAGSFTPPLPAIRLDPAEIGRRRGAATSATARPRSAAGAADTAASAAGRDVGDNGVEIAG